MTTTTDVASTVRQMVADELAAVDVYDADAIACTIVDRLSRREVEMAARWAIGRLVQQLAAQDRGRLGHVPHGDQAGIAEAPVSTRWAQASTAWKRALDSWEAWTDADGVIHRTRLGDMTADQIRSSAAARRRLAAATIAAADRLDRLAELLDATGAATPRELPEDQATEVLA